MTTWTVEACQATHGEQTVICDTDGYIIARMMLCEDNLPGWKHPESEEGRAARLMAAAPALLAALRQAFEEIHHPGQYASNNQGADISDYIRAAIAAAKGE